MRDSPRRAVFEEVFGATWAKVYAYCANRLRNSDDARDAAQRVYEITLRRWNDLPADETQRTLWIMGVAYRVCADEFRARRRRRSLTERITHQRQTSQIDPADEATARDLADRMLESLDDRSQLDTEILLLLLEEHSAQAIADIVGTSVSAASSRVHRLRAYLESRGLGATVPDAGGDIHPDQEHG